MITLSQSAKQSIDFSKMCWLQGLCSRKSYFTAKKTIIADDIKKQAERQKGFI